MSTPRTLLRTPLWTGAIFVWSAVMAVLCFPGAIEPAPGEPTWVPVAMLPLFVAAAVRAVLVGVVVTDREVVVRNFGRTRRIGRDEVVEVRLKNYDGFLAWNSPGGAMAAKSVQIRTRSGKVVMAYGLLGPSRAINARIRRLRGLLELPVGGHEPPKHRLHSG